MRRRTVPLNVRIDDQTSDRLQRAHEHLVTQLGTHVSMATAISVVLSKGLDCLDAEKK